MTSSAATNNSSDVPVLPEPISALVGIERLREGGRERQGFVGLDRNERLAPLPEWLLDEIRAGIESSLLTQYPALDALYEDLSGMLQVPRQQLLLTAGSDAAFRALHQVYVRPGDRVVMLDPSYAMYPIYARMFAAVPVQVPFASDLSVDGQQLVDAVGAGVRMVLLADPNQPTGTQLPREVLRAVLARAAEHDALVVADEAYFPFSRTTVLSWLAEYPHLVVTRTFSKAWGLAGLRVGVVAAHPEVIANLYKVRSAYDINAVAALCVRTLLAHPEVAEQFVAEVDAGRRTLEQRLPPLGLKPLAGQTNFQLIRCVDRIAPAELVKRAHDRGYLVKGPFSAPCLADCIRITLGPSAVMEQFCDVLEEVLDGR
jgi:histidinol-phosphate aminotransferase